MQKSQAFFLLYAKIISDILRWGELDAQWGSDGPLPCPGPHLGEANPHWHPRGHQQWHLHLALALGDGENWTALQRGPHACFLC